MKKIFLTILTLTSSLTFFGQNTFPATGNVGIGTSEPEAILNIQSSSTIAGSDLSQASLLLGSTSTGLGIDTNEIYNKGLDLHIGTLSEGRDLYFKAGGTSNRMTIEGTTGNIGIGTTNPEAILNIQSSSTIAGSDLSQASLLLGSTSTGLGIDTNEIYNKGLDLHIGTLSEGRDLYFKAGGTSNRMTIEGTTGNIGIGTSEPEAILNIQSSSTIAGSDLSQASLLLGSTSTGLGIDTNEIYNKGLDLHIGTLSEGRDLYFKAGGTSNRMTIEGTTGNIGIGTSNPDSPLTVKGKIHCEEVKVDVAVPADYVFEKYYTGVSELKAEYTMPTLEEVETYTKENHHLPNIPSATEIKEEGLHLKEMTNLLLQKVEELTLYTIEQEKRINTLERKLVTQK